MVQRKRINVEEAQKALEQLDHIPNEMISARRFIQENFETIYNAKKSLRATHQHLLQCGIDVGDFSYFRNIYNSTKRAKKLASLAVSTPSPKLPTEVQAAIAPPITPDRKTDSNVTTERQGQSQNRPTPLGEKTRAMNSNKSDTQINPDSTFNITPLDPDDLPDFS